MSFDHPWILVLLVLPLAAVVGCPGPALQWPGQALGWTGPWRRRRAIASRPAGGPLLRLQAPRPGRLLRSLAMACLVLALAGPSLPLPSRGLAVAVVVDRSASMEPVLDQVTRAVDGLLSADSGTGLGGDPVQVAVISAGGEPAVERSPGPVPQPPLTWTAPAQREATDLAAALRLAAASLPSDHRRRVVLISDGQQTRGDAVAEARALAAAGAVLDTVVVNPDPRPDLAVTGLDVPATARPGRPAAVQVTLRAHQAGPARLHLLAGDQAVASRPVQLAAGDNRFVLTVTPERPGPLPLRAVIEAVPPSTSTEPANDAFTAVLQVEGARPVLVLSPHPDPPLARLLAAQGIPVESRRPAQRPSDLAGWGRYGAVILDNVPAPELGEAAMADLERFVRDLGGGLVMAGMPDTFGPGGYTGTPVERALPVHSDLRNRKNLPTVALALVIDRSGSMAGLKLQMAVEAARRVAQLLTPADRLAVVLFDSQAYVTRPLEPVRDPGEVDRAFPAAAEGGTSLGRGLAAALPLMEGVQADVRHVIALTDGVSEPFDVTGLARAFRRQGVTLSAVAIGPDADRNTLAQLAREGGGALYEAADPSQLPTLLTRDTALTSRRFIRDEPFRPVVTAAPAPGGPGAILQEVVPSQVAAPGDPGSQGGPGAPGGPEAAAGPGAPGEAGGGPQAPAGTGALLPPLGGYVLTAPRDRAEVLLASEAGDPVLGAWFYGLGRAVAWTAPTAGPGIAAWTGGAGPGGTGPFARLWANIADWLLEGAAGGSGPWQVAARATPAGTVTVTVEGSPPLSGKVRLGDAEALLIPVAAGRSEAVLPAPEPGVHPVVVEPAAGGTGTLRTVVAVPYPAEFLQTGSDPVLMETLAGLTGGRAVRLEAWDPRSALDPQGVPAPPGRWFLWPYLLLAAAVLLPADVAARRLGWTWGSFRRIPAALATLLRPGRAQQAARDLRQLGADPPGPASSLAGHPAAGAAGQQPGDAAIEPVTLSSPAPDEPAPPGRSAAAHTASGAAAQTAWQAEGTPARSGTAGTSGAPGAQPVQGSPAPAAAQDAGLARLRAARQRSRARTAERVRRHVDPSAGP
ncbi:VWA domain-containing protein [Thermaerobacter sp. PB12/4term]|uniref:VWA domain-containing protein n=1 Tax=Thermaerobacter sp. PB12/4term TaxID=2293838 RepID=UPI000E326FDE|nr:VWA domain-containing protein [Thermaerobacter sp. PB12/4term]QIA27695.1 VWA domain-containing protein [Thermaerobacter sp. PB12/4term]